MTDKITKFSPCMQYRYYLYRDLGSLMAEKDLCAWICCNPSTAGFPHPLDDDPTLRRIQSFSRRWGFRRAVMLNIFSYRSTDPKGLYTHPDPIGPENDRWLRLMGHGAALLIAAWGTHGKFRDRGAQVAAMFPGKLHCLRVTADGHPSHPLYLPGDLEPVPYTPK